MNSRYQEMLPAWRRARDVMAGEDAVKAAGEKYLPRLDRQSDEEYAAYKTRAAFIGAPARTLASSLDLVFRKAPTIAVPDELKSFMADCDGSGMPFLRYARRVLSEVLSAGRAGSLVRPGGDRRMLVRLYRAEEIVDWEVDAGTGALKSVNLGMPSPQPSPTGEGVTIRFGDGVEGAYEGARPPFVFHGVNGCTAEVGELPMADLIAASLDHYRLDADYKRALHFAALPTAWVCGFEKGADLRVGSSTAWTSEIPGATAGFLEFSGSAIQYIERALDRVERRMALLGASMPEKAAPEGETASPAQPQYLSGLADVVRSVNESLSRVLEMAFRSVAGSEPATGQILFALNTAFEPSGITAPEITAVVQAWSARAISKDTMLDYFKRRELLPEGRAVAEERALIRG